MSRNLVVPFVGFGQKGRQLRFFGKPGVVGFHLEEGSKLGSSACPAVCSRLACQACQSCNPKLLIKLAALAWDIDKDKWVACVASHSDFSKIMSACCQTGCTPEMMELGNGPDVIVQGWRESLMVVAVPESIGEKRGDGKVPCLEEQVGLLSKRSKFSAAKD